MPGKIKRNAAAFLFIVPSLAGFVLFYIWPFFSSLGYAVVDRPVNGTFVGLKNFVDLVQNKSYLRGLQNTLFFIGFSLPLNMAISLAVASLINRLRHKDIWTLVFLIPLVIPSGSMVFFWKAFFAREGFLNGLLYAAGLGTVNWLDSSVARYVIILIFIWKNMGYNMVLFIAGLNNIPREFYEAAAVEGAGGFQRFRRVTLVYLLPTLLLVTIMSVINSFKVFKEVFLITGAYPHESIYMLQHYMNNMFSSLNYQRLTTATCLLVLVITVVTQLLFRLEKRFSQ
jgi:multiple sugar transport system permease protein